MSDFVSMAWQRAGEMMPSSDDRQGAAPTTQDAQLTHEATEWFMRQGASDCSSEDQARLDAWRRTSPAHDLAFRRVAALWESPEMTVATQRVSALAGPADAIRHNWVQTRTAAAMAAMILLVSLATWKTDVLTWLRADYVTAVGEQRIVTLPDRSVLTLNTNSAVAVRYDKDRRVIHLLQGEASFAVQPDLQRPFTVDTHGITATALGTDFLVRDSRHDVEVTVVHGSVEVRAAQASVPAVLLRSGEHVAVGPKGPGAVTQIDAAGQAAWRQGRLVFVRAALSDVIQELSRYHRGYLGIWNPALERLPVTGIYDLKEPGLIVTTLAETLPIRVARLTDHLIVIR